MSPIPCRLLYQSASPHLQQLHTGLLLLHRSGFIRITQALRPKQTAYAGSAPHLRDASHAHLDAVVAGNLRLHFDTHDAKEIAESDLEQCDFYFKRSYLQSLVDTMPTGQRSKILPLGLYYRVLPDIVDPLELQRSLTLKGTLRNRLSAFRRALDTWNLLGFEPRLTAMEAPPDSAAAPKVLFQVAAYDPYDEPDRTREKIEDRIAINEMRASCLRLLRKSLGASFIGGFSSSRFTRERYPDLVVPPTMTAKENYLAAMKSFPICIATTGLHGSIGGKLAEYVALSKAIVTEKLVYQVPGPFEPGRNYLEFTSPDECVQAAVRLVENADLRRDLMRNNAVYYRSFVRPDVLVRNALTTAMERHQIA